MANGYNPQDHRHTPLDHAQVPRRRQGCPISLRLGVADQRWRPNLLPLLHDDLGPPCTSCGRRFRTDNEGRTRKAAHMDWHFYIRQRLAEAKRESQQRSWYVGEADWKHF